MPRIGTMYFYWKVYLPPENADKYSKKIFSIRLIKSLRRIAVNILSKELRMKNNDFFVSIH